MLTDQTERLADLVASALDCAAAERAQFLSDVCGDDVALREEAESLLRFENNARDFIETPAFEVAADEILDEVSEPVPAEAPIGQNDTAVEYEPVPAEALFIQDETAVEPEPVPMDGPFAHNEVAVESEPVPVEAPFVQSEAAIEFEPLSVETSIVQNETAVASELAPAEAPTLRSGAAVESEPVAAEAPIVEIGAAVEFEPLPVEAPIVQNEATVESTPELQSPEIAPKEIVSEAPPEKPKQKPRQEYESASQGPARPRKSSAVPAFPAKEHVSSRPVEFVWARRLALIALAVIVVATLIALNSALREEKNARRQRDIAETERARTERINNFLQRIIYASDQNFAPIWPVAQKRNITVIEMLDRIEPQIQNELADEPDVRGEVLRRIGDAYASQGAHDAAEKNLRAALKAQTAAYGEGSVEVVETMVDLGVLLYRREKFAEAEGFLEKGATFFRKLNQTEGGRTNAVKLAYVLDQLGAVKFYRGDVENGRAILEEALEVATQAQPKGPDRSVLTSIKTDLGGLLVLVGELRKGETLLQESLAESRAITNAPQWETGVTLQMLGEWALAKNRPGEAKDDFLAAEEIYRGTLGEKNLYFARNLERRATVSLVENDLAAAEELARRSLAITKEASPDNKLPWTDSMATLSSILIKAGRAAEGEDYLRKAIHICEDQPTRNYAAIALAKIRLSQLFLSQKRYTEAENLAFEAHNEAQQHLEPEDPMRKATTNNLIQIYEVQGKHEAANAVK